MRFFSTLGLAWNGVQARGLSTVPRSTPSKFLSLKKAAERFRDKPGSHMTTFAILHEITAIIPFPIIYFALDASGIKVPVPENVVAEGNKAVSRVRARWGYEPLEPQNQTMVNLATTYAIIKVLFPVRIFASVALTPFFAEKAVGPLLARASSVARKFKRPS